MYSSWWIQISISQQEDFTLLSPHSSLFLSLTVMDLVSFLLPYRTVSYHQSHPIFLCRHLCQTLPKRLHLNRQVQVHMKSSLFQKQNKTKHNPTFLTWISIKIDHHRNGHSGSTPKSPPSSLLQTSRYFQNHTVVKYTALLAALQWLFGKASRM